MIDPIFTRGEYWLLETAVQMGIPISSLLADGIEMDFNKPGHGMDSVSTNATLTGLSRKGLIHLYQYNTKSGESQPATTAGVLEGLTGKTGKLYYKLTAEGGLQWEAFAFPNWNRFIDHWTSYDDSGNELHTVEAANRELLRRIFDGLHYEGVTPNLETVRWTEISPWQATYWKELSQGCRLEFTSAPRKPSFMWDDMPLSYYWISRPRWYSWA